MAHGWLHDSARTRGRSYGLDERGEREARQTPGDALAMGSKRRFPSADTARAALCWLAGERYRALARGAESTVITLDALVAGESPTSRDEAVALMGLLAAAQTRLAASFAGLAITSTEDRLLDVDEAAQRLGVDRQWLYRRTKSLPFVVRLDGAVRYSAQGVERFIAAKRGR
jgi:predicted DNA-binding transcriptional regulator AlpA